MNQLNLTPEEMEKARIDRLAASLEGNPLGTDDPQKPEPQGQPAQQTYSPNEGGTAAKNVVNSEQEKYVSLLKNTFNYEDQEIFDNEGKINTKLENIAKSYISAQRFGTERNQKFQEEEKKLKIFEQVLGENPDLANALKRAMNGERTENPINVSKPTDGRNEPIQGTNSSDLQIELSEEGLMKAGLLDPASKPYMDDNGWQNFVKRARERYMVEVYPRLLEKQLSEQVRKQSVQILQEQTRQQELDRIKQENAKRYNDGIDRAVIELGFKPASEHADLVDEVNRRVRAYRDPLDPERLIRSDAVLRAVHEVFEEKGIRVRESAGTGVQNDPYFNPNPPSRQTPSKTDKPFNLNDALSERYKAMYQEDYKRNQLRLT